MQRRRATPKICTGDLPSSQGVVWKKGMHCEAIQLEADLLEYDCLLGHCGASWPVFWIETKIYKRTWDLPEVGDQTCKFKTSAIWLRWPQ